MLDIIIEKTSEYIESMPKKERKRYGQFFTSGEIARYMADLFVIPEKEKISILDAGAGSGILTCSLVERLNTIEGIKQIDITCYETDLNVLPLLQENLAYIQRESEKIIAIQITRDNYITSQYLDFNCLIGGKVNPKKYDLVIGNPPYMKIPKDAPEAKAMPNICYGAPNMYSIFAAMGLFNLKDNGEMVYIIPRSWTSGAYFKKFREYFLSQGKLLHIHLFGSRKRVFDKEEVLQETIIVKVKKTCEKPESVKITSTNTSKEFDKCKEMIVPYDLVVSGEELFVYLVTNEEEVAVLDKLKRWHKTLPELGLRMKTGLTVDFRNRNLFESTSNFPLFSSLPRLSTC